MRRMQGQWALVTGASAGIGRDIAEVLAELGCNLVLTARREDRLADLKKLMMGKYGIEATVIALDLAEPGAPETLYRAIQDQGIRIDILINNAGYGVHGWFVDVPWEKTGNMLQLLINNLTHLTKLFVDDMVARDHGYILQVASTGAFQPTPTFAAYGAAKAYVLNLSVALNFELRKTNVRCSVLCPGVTLTEFQQVSGHEDHSFIFRALAMSSRQVARIGVAAMLKGKSIAVAGAANAFNAKVMSILPRPLAAAVAYLTLGPPRELGG